MFPALWINSGDLVIMAGKSRVAYHAVPCIVKESASDEPPEPLKLSVDPIDVVNNEMDIDVQNTTEKQTVDKDILSRRKTCHCSSESCQNHLWSHFNMSKNEWEPFANYLSKTRININVRQVHRR